MSNKSSKRLTVLFAPLDGWGHINCSHGLAEELLNRGHRVVFAVSESQFKGKLLRFGFEEELLSAPQNGSEDKWCQMIEELSLIFENKDPADVAVPMINVAIAQMIDDNIHLDSQYKNIIQRVKPDLIIVDNYVNCPAITNCGRPWIWLYSAAPLGIYNNKELPPRRSGFPLNDHDKTKWDTFNSRIANAVKPLYQKLNEFCISRGAPPLPLKSLHPSSPFLNIYLYVKELDYSSDGYEVPNNFLRVENFIRTTNEKFEIPENISKGTGSLIFLSMGSFGCANLKLMTRLTRILAKSKHRFIVAKGPLEYELPDNMWGQKFVPQMAILPKVDAVITHGGNNTVTESFYFGKPMLILPLFGDQYDNAQRIQETGLGLRLSPFHCEEYDLISCVDRLVSDNILIEKCLQIGERMRATNDKIKVIEIIENKLNSK